MPVLKIGIYGGTFDPPHLGHMEAARAAIAALGLDQLIFIPAKQPPHKDLSDESATPEQRLALTCLMADGLLLPKVTVVSDLELNREGKSYTVDTLRILKERYPQDELWLLVGTDMFLSLQNWYQAEEIMKLAAIADEEEVQRLNVLVDQLRENCEEKADPRRGRALRSKVSFLNRKTGKVVDIITERPAITTEDKPSRIHPDPHPHFVCNDKYIVCTASDKEGYLRWSITPVDQLIRLTSK